MTPMKQLEVWFLTGSQQLYGEEILKQVAAHSRMITAALGKSRQVPVRIVFKPVLTTPDAIRSICLEANSSSRCIGLIAWMHTFSPAKMWIAGLKALAKPLLHLHTQFNRDIPWESIDMDFMNLNQSAHGDREFGYICTRMGLRRKVVVGHWQDPEVHREIGVWTRAAAGWNECRNMKVARFGDNMRQVAVTEGDKVEAQIRLGWEVNGYGIGELAKLLPKVSAKDIRNLIKEYTEAYHVAAPLRPGAPRHDELVNAARIELAMRAFLDAGQFKAFTTTFEDLHGLEQLPGLASQRLMADGFGFGAEGDWKTAALVRALKVMGEGLGPGASFMEDYTYHLDPAGTKVLGAHMLEVCPSIAAAKPALEMHPLSIGGKSDPARLVFDAAPGPAVNASLIDMGDRFRLIVNDVEVMAPDAPLPKLPVARALWRPLPDLKISAAAWILAGGAHHTAFSQAIGKEHLADFAEMAGIEMFHIGNGTTIDQFKRDIY